MLGMDRDSGSQVRNPNRLTVIVELDDQRYAVGML
jgi:hypothetical protein